MKRKHLAKASPQYLAHKLNYCHAVIGQSHTLFSCRRKVLFRRKKPTKWDNYADRNENLFPFLCRERRETPPDIEVISFSLALYFPHFSFFFACGGAIKKAYAVKKVFWKASIFFTLWKSKKKREYLDAGTIIQALENAKRGDL